MTVVRRTFRLFPNFLLLLMFLAVLLAGEGPREAAAQSILKGPAPATSADTPATEPPGLWTRTLIYVRQQQRDLQRDLATLRDGALPRLVKLAQLAQEASATSSIAPALSTKPVSYTHLTLPTNREV